MGRLPVRKQRDYREAFFYDWEILDTSRLDFTQEKQNAETFDLSDTLPQICGPYQLIAKAKQLDFCLEIREKCPVCIQRGA